MKSEALISIIIPIYNVQLFLTDCINSVLNQSYKNFEIILINDGSTDDSLNICKSFLTEHNRIKLIEQTNQGLSAARNKGIEEASGSYIAFLDSDDLIHRDYLKILIENIGNSDMSICRIEEFQDGDDIDLNSTLHPTVNELSGRDMNEFLYHHILAAETIIAPNKLYKKSLWDNYRFPIGKLHEDCAIIYKITDLAIQVALIDSALYYYRKRNNSITSVRSFKSIRDEYDATTEQILFFEQKKQFNIVKNANRFRKSLFLNDALDKNWETWRKYTILDILRDDLRTKVKIKLIKKKLHTIFDLSR